MSRHSGIKLALAACCAAFVAWPAAQAADPPAKGPAELQGCWKLVSIEANGESVDPVGGGQPRWVIKGDTISHAGAEVIKLVADATTTPRVIDLKFRDPDRVYEGVYVVEKDMLKVCLNKRADAKDRPGVFSTKDQPDWRLLVFARQKEAPKNPAEGATAFAGVQLRTDEDTKAVVVDAPIKSSAAEKAGLKKGDVILKIGATAAADLQGTVEAVRKAKPGEKLDFRIRRGDKEQTITVAVGVFPFHWAAGLE